MESLLRLQGLHADLIAFTQNSLLNLDRLVNELRESIADFRALLDQTKSTDEDAKHYREGKVEVAGQEYGVNEEFRHLSNQIGNTLEISEEYAARLYIETQASGDDDEDEIIASVVAKYHDRRDYLLQDLRLLLTQSLEPEVDSDAKRELQEVIRDILDIKNGVVANGSVFARKCMQAMLDLENRQTSLNDQIQSKAILSKARGEAFYMTLEYQRSCIFKQHEAVGAILALLFRGNYTTGEDLRKLLERSRTWQRLDFNWIHYLPAFAAGFHQYGSPDRATAQDALSINRAVIDSQTIPANLPYRPLAATLEMWWTAEYSGHYADSARPDANFEKRSEIMKRALDDGALDFMLSICTNMKSDPWQQVARTELVQMLLDGSNIAFEGVEQTSSYFATMVMEAYEGFAESWITNMPDSIRQLKTDEDDRRLLQITATSDGLLQRPPRDHGVRLHLESFLVIIAFAFEGRPDSQEQFWDDPDSNLYGFVQWASRRQTVPRVSAFCKMLCAISESSENAENAHKFLTEDAVVLPNSRGRKLPSMSYQQIFAELEFYSRKIHEKSQPPQTVKLHGGNIDPELNEQESPIMLCCYLRLLAHLFRHSIHARYHARDLPEFNLLKSLLVLSSGPIPSYLRACIFAFFEALLTDKSLHTSTRIWSEIEAWAATNHDRGVPTSNDKQVTPSTAALQNSLSAIAASHDQYDAFVKLLLALVEPLPEKVGQPLPFPPDLGGTYRAPGIVPYIDFVCGQLTPRIMRNWLEEGYAHGIIRTLNAINFMISCLQGFNEHFVLEIGKSALNADESYEVLYVQRHPFARVMQWIFSTDLNRCLMDLLHHPVDSILLLGSGDPKLTQLESLVDLLNWTINLQPTYFDIVKPRLRISDGYRPIQFSGITAIEDSISARPQLVLDLCQYAASEHVRLSLRSLTCLEKLSESARFQNHLFDESKRDRKCRQMIEMIGPEGELKLKNISLRLKDALIIDPRELEAARLADGYLLKDGIVAFFNACLSTQSESPNIAHLLLGFQRIGSRLVVGQQLETGDSMFDSLVTLSQAYPDMLDGEILSWLTHIKAETMCALKHLWSFPVSSDLTMMQLRRSNYLCLQLLSVVLVAQGTLWDGHSVLDGSFYFHTSAEAFTDLLSFRTHLYDYMTREIQAVAKAHIKALQDKYASAIQGKSIDQDGLTINHATIFDLFDFAELDTRPPPSLGGQSLTFFDDVDFDAYKKYPLYDVEKVHLVLNSRSRQITEAYEQAQRSLDNDALSLEVAFVVSLLEARNRYVLAQAERHSCLRSYVGMIISIVECCPMDPAVKTQFVLHMLQLSLPKLDTYLTDGTPEAVELTRMADTLLFALASPQTADPTQNQTRLDVTIAERLFQLFRISAEGIALSSTNPDLRVVLYSICAQYLVRILSSPSTDNDANNKARSNAMDTVRSAGTPLITILSDDADDGLDTCRINALNLLAQLVSLARSQTSNLIIEAFIKSNILEVLLDPIKNIVGEFQATEPSNRSHLLPLIEARTLLLLQVSRTHAGSCALLDAGLIQTLRDTLLFAIDPDLGFDFGAIDPTALARSNVPSVGQHTTIGPQKSALLMYFTLLSSCLRLLLSTFTTFGVENEKNIFHVRAFLNEYRGNMVGCFKRAAGLNFVAQQQRSLFGSTNGAGGLTNEDRELRRVVGECVQAYTGLAIGSGFLEMEDERGGRLTGVMSGSEIGSSNGGGGAGAGGFGRSFGMGGGFT